MLPKVFRAPDAEAGSGGGVADQVFIVAEGDALQLPENFDPAGASFVRAGPDLMLTSADGNEIVVADFFMSETPPALIGGDGAKVSGDLAVRLAGPRAPGAVAGEAAPLEAIGRVTSLTGEVTVIRADGTRVTLHAGDSMFMGDILETGVDSGVGVLLADGTSLSMADEGRMVLDEMVYDPGTQEGSVSLSVLKGVFTIVSGEVSKTDPDAMQVHTPMATIGIRGTQIGIDLTGEHGLTVVMMEEADSFIGEVTVTNDGGVMTLNQAYYALTVDSFISPPAPAQIFAHDTLLNTFGVTFAFLPVSGTNANDYGLQASLAEGLANFDALSGEDAAAFETSAGGEQAADEADASVPADDGGEEIPPEEGLAEFEAEVEAEAEAEAEAPVPDEFVTDAGEAIAPDNVAFGEEIAPMPVMEDIAAAALGEIDVTAPPPPAEVPPAPVIDPVIIPEPENVAPVAEPGAVLTAEDNIFTGQLAASDLEGGTLLFDVAEGGEPINGAVAISSDGTFSYTPDSDFGGEDTFTYQVTDDAGNVSTATVSVTVTPVADLPVLAVAGATGSEDTGISLAIAADMPAGTSETISSITISGVPEGAWLSTGTDNGDGTWGLTSDQLSGLILTPPIDYSGTIALSVTAVSSDGGLVVQDLSATVTAVADVPVIAVADVTGAEDTGVSLTIAASMPGGTTEEVASVTISGVPDGATLSAGTDNGDGSWTLTPDQLSGLTLTPPTDYSGTIVLSVTALSSDGGTTSQDLSATVTAVADVPTLTVSDVVVELPPVPGVEIEGGKGDDVLVGGAGDDSIDGGKGDDILVGGAGDDIIDGGKGDDVIYGDQAEGDVVVDDDDDGKHDDDDKHDDDGKHGDHDHDDGGDSDVPVLLPITEVPLNVEAALTDVDGSEALSIQIEGVPDGAILSLGADNGDGVWTLTGEDLSNLDSLTMTLAEGTAADDFSLSVTATSTEASTGEFSTASGVIDVTFEGGSTGGGADILSGGQGDDTIYAGGGADILDGGQGDDALYGGAGDDQLEGGKGDDELYGGAGDDQLDGGQGDDLIDGGAGDDVLVGGKGEDTFVFRAGDGDDIILDFGQQDELRFEGPEFSADDFSLQTNGDESATITFGGDAGVSVTLNDFEYEGGGEGYSVVQDGDAVVVTFNSDDQGGCG